MPAFSVASAQPGNRGVLLDRISSFIHRTIEARIDFLLIQMNSQSNCTSAMINLNPFARAVVSICDMIAHKPIQVSKCISFNKPKNILDFSS